jgi:hypothetical protein
LRIIFFILFQYQLACALSQDIIIQWNDKVSELMIKDGFSPYWHRELFCTSTPLHILFLKKNAVDNNMPALAEISNLHIKTILPKKINAEIAISEAMYLIAANSPTEKKNAMIFTMKC